MQRKALPVLQKIKKVFQKKENFLILALAGVLLFIIAIPTQKKGEDVNPQVVGNETMTQDQTTAGNQATGQTITGQSITGQITGQYALEQEERLTRLLEQVEGVGRVEVMVTLEQSAEEVALSDQNSENSTVSEQDANGGTRESNEQRMEEQTVMIENAQGVLVPYVVKIREPVINGIVVIADGGANDDVRKNITEMIQALFGIEAHKIKVVKMKSE